YNRRMSGPDDQGERPEYRVYGGGGRRPKQPRRAPAEPGAGAGEQPDYNVYRARPRGLFARLRGQDEMGEGPPAASSGGRGRISAKRVITAILVALLGWLLLSLVLFVISAQIQQSGVSSQAKSALSSGGTLPFSKSTILVLGSDARPKGKQFDCGKAGCGEPRADSILLMRIGGGASARLSIPRDTYVSIPGHGKNKINASYSIGSRRGRGNPALTIRTVEGYLGIRVNHLIEVNFGNFRPFIDSLGGVDVKVKCLIDDINGGTRNGGVSFRFRRPGTHHLNGKQALGFARARHNRCRSANAFGDIERAQRQQQVLSAMKGRALSIGGLLKLPWISWAAPKTIRSDMGGGGLLGLFSALATSGTPPTNVLRPSSTPSIPGVGDVVMIADSTRRRAVRRFLKG
ncbi:MAG: LCP family protein, partial [Solirubrobacteraceae bacterium]